MRKQGETKTRKSRRTIALPKQVVDVLEEHMRWQKQERASRDGVEPDRSCLHDSEWRAAGRRKAGLEPEWTPRELRHSFVSLLSDHGIPLERIALLVGHSSQTTTEAVYRKQLRPVITQGAEAMDDIFAEDQEGEAPEGDAVA